MVTEEDHLRLGCPDSLGKPGVKRLVKRCQETRGNGASLPPLQQLSVTLLWARKSRAKRLFKKKKNKNKNQQHEPGHERNYKMLGWVKGKGRDGLEYSK